MILIDVGGVQGCNTLRRTCQIVPQLWMKIVKSTKGHGEGVSTLAA